MNAPSFRAKLRKTCEKAPFRKRAGTIEEQKRGCRVGAVHRPERPVMCASGFGRKGEDRGNGIWGPAFCMGIKDFIIRCCLRITIRIKGICSFGVHSGSSDCQSELNHLTKILRFGQKKKLFKFAPQTLPDPSPTSPGPPLRFLNTIYKIKNRKTNREKWSKKLSKK